MWYVISPLTSSLRQQRLDDLLDDELADLVLARRRACAASRRRPCRSARACRPSYSTVTWLLLSGRSQSTSPFWRASVRRLRMLVGQRDRQRHQLGRVVAGVAEHQALVAGADLLALRGVLVDAHGDVGALPVDREHHGAGVGADAHLVVGVADVADHLADDVGIVDHGLGGDFAGDDGDAGGDHRLAGHAAVWGPGRTGRRGCRRRSGRPACRDGPC